MPIHLEHLAARSPSMRLPVGCQEYIHAEKFIRLPYSRYRAKLLQYGLLVIHLTHGDDGEFFQNLVENLGKPHLHNENADSALWDIQVTAKQDSQGHLARSQQGGEFFLHTDCSYEIDRPDHFGLYVLHPDQFGGGKLLLVEAQKLVRGLSDSSLLILRNQPVTLRVPQEFYKGISSIRATLIDGEADLRYRHDIIDRNNLSPQQTRALCEFETLAYSMQYMRTLFLKKHQILLLNNKRYLHGRTAIKDPKRHLQRIRFFLNPQDDVHGHHT